MRKFIHFKSSGSLFLLKGLMMTIIMLLSAFHTHAQNRQITGTVADENDELLPGATVFVPGTTFGATAGGLGTFQLNVPDTVKTIHVSFMGYHTEIVDVTGRNTVHVVLRESGIALEEIQIVEIGYGTVKRGNLTGSVGQVSGDKLEGREAVNPVSLINGLVSGVEVRTNTGEPGGNISFRIRGSASVNADTEPLYVVDGVPVDDLDGVSVSDIQTIDILKDASSAAIYGSRGANGVIIISTKMPQKGSKTKVEFSASYGLQQLERKADILSPQEWITFRSNYNNARYVEKFASKGATANDDYITRIQMGASGVGYVNDPRWTMPNHGGLKLIDWQDEFFRIAPIQSYNLSVDGSSAQTSYRVSVGYMNQDGIALNTNFNKLTMQARLQTSLFNDLIRLRFDFRPSVTNNSGGRVDGKDNMGQRVLSMTPVAEPDAGIYTNSEPFTKYDWASNGISPIAYMEQITRESESLNLASTLNIDFNIREGLKATLTGSNTFKSGQSHNFTPSTINSRWNQDPVGYQTTASRSNSRSRKYLFQAVINYDKALGDHNLSAMAGYSMESSSSSSSLLSAKQFPNNALETFDMNDEVITAARALFGTPVRLVSVFGRLQYEYDNRYVLTASIREDGSSRFGKDNRWGVFPAISGAYRISNEPFWPQNIPVNMLKFRVSWGANGNNRVSDTAALGILSSANYSYNGSLINGYAPSSIDNSELGWEKTYSWNFAVDMGLFRNRISLTVEHYDKLTKDLLYQVSVPASMGFTRAWGNIGSIRNRGWEFEIISRNILNKEFQWTTNLNASYNKNKVESLGDDNSTVFLGYSTTQTQVLMVGEPIGAYFMYDAVGVYQFSDDLLKYPIMKGSALGDVRYRDVNQDGKIDDSDRTLVGKPSPDWIYGFTNTFKYKRWQLSIHVTAQTGGQIYSVLGRAIDRPGMGASVNVLSHWKNMWISEEQPGDGKTPSINSTTTGSLYDSRWLYSTDFIKIKNLTLSYRFKPKKSSLISNASVYLSMENLWMWDKYSGGFSPETNNGNLLQAYDYGSYPQARVITLGGKISF